CISTRQRSTRCSRQGDWRFGARLLRSRSPQAAENVRYVASWGPLRSAAPAAKWRRGWVLAGRRLSGRHRPVLLAGRGGGEAPGHVELDFAVGANVRFPDTGAFCERRDLGWRNQAV